MMINNSTNIAKILQEKVVDYKRFAFILLALSVFLFLGLIIPNEGVSQTQHSLLIGLSFASLAFAKYFHKKAMKFQEKLFSEE